MLENAHMGARVWGPGSAMRHHQLSTRSTKNGAAIIYANDCNFLREGGQVPWEI